MLTRLVLENIAIIASLNVEFQRGLNAVTGETGAGKSLIVEAIQRVFDKSGQRGGSAGGRQWLRQGASRGRIELTFDLQRLRDNEALMAVLAEAGVEILPDETDMTVSREFTASGSRSRINGSQVTQEWMGQLGGLFLEIYGQHDLHNLFTASRQRDLLDSLGGEPMRHLRQEVRTTFRSFQQLGRQRDALRQAQADRLKQRDYLQYQVDEILNAEIIDADEDVRLQQERDRLANRVQLSQAAQQVLTLLTGFDHPDAVSMLSLLGQIQKQIGSSQALEPKFQGWGEQLGESQAMLKEVGHEIQDYLARLEMNPERMQEIIDRLDTLERLKRKHGGTLEAVMKTATELEAQLDGLQGDENRLAEIEDAWQETESRFTYLAQALHELRDRLAGTLAETVSHELADLMMPGARFEIELTPQAPGEAGSDEVRFLFSANPGEPVRPLQAVASGGELARLMLALKIHTAHSDAVPTLILDEVDTGMSGKAARAVGEKLAQLQAQCQLIVVTHQPIVAAQASWHIHLQKRLQEGRVEVAASPLVHAESRKTILSQLASGFDAADEATTQFVSQLLATSQTAS